jgi:hypothetical protein
MSQPVGQVRRSPVGSCVVTSQTSGDVHAGGLQSVTLRANHYGVNLNCSLVIHMSRTQLQHRVFEAPRGDVISVLGSSDCDSCALLTNADRWLGQAMQSGGAFWHVTAADEASDAGIA